MVRQLAASFVAVPPSGTSAQTRLEVTEAEDATLWELYRFGGRLRASDLRLLVEMNATGAAVDAEMRKTLAAARKRNMTPLWSSRVAGAVYRDNDEMWALAKRNLQAHIDTLDERIAAIEDRLEIPVGAKGRIPQPAHSRREALPAGVRLPSARQGPGQAGRQPAEHLFGRQGSGPQSPQPRRGGHDAGPVAAATRRGARLARGERHLGARCWETRPCASIPTTASWSCCCPPISRICPTRQGRARRGD